MKYPVTVSGSMNFILTTMGRQCKFSGKGVTCRTFDYVEVMDYQPHIA